MKAIVLDSGAFIQGYNPGGTSTESFTVPAVRSELKSEAAKTRFDNAALSGALKVIYPEEHYVERVEKAAMRMGESGALSITDKQILALGLLLASRGYRPLIVTDDYSVQNMARDLELPYRGLTTQGITKRIQWEIYCPGCRKKFDEPQPEDICPVCGTRLKRKPKRTY